MLFTELGMSMDVRLVHLAKEPVPILLTEFGIVMEGRLVQELKT